MQETEDIVTLPCPFCGDSDIYLDHDQGAWPMMRCQGCGATGPCVNTEPALARKAWNMQPTIATLRAEVEGLRADAERYRWLRKMLAGDAPMIRAAHAVIDSDYVWQMDAAIDAAKASKEGA